MATGIIIIIIMAMVAVDRRVDARLHPAAGRRRVRIVLQLHAASQQALDQRSMPSIEDRGQTQRPIKTKSGLMLQQWRRAD